jgi:hypothetical protein
MTARLDGVAKKKEPAAEPAELQAAREPAVLELTDSSLDLYCRPRLTAHPFGIGRVMAPTPTALRRFP